MAGNYFTPPDYVKVYLSMTCTNLHSINTQVNLAAGFVVESKEDSTLSINLINDPNQGVTFVSTKFPQGRSKMLYGPPYTVTIGIPISSHEGTTKGKIQDQKLFLDLVRSNDIISSDIFGSSKFLAVMINGGAKVENLAWNEGHMIFLLAKNSKSKVGFIHYDENFI